MRPLRRPVRRPPLRRFAAAPLAMPLVVLPLLAAAAAAHAGLPPFEPLGDLPGGPFHSYATNVSADGSTVVGRSASSDAPNSYEAFRWTVATGMEGLGDLGTAFVDSRAEAVSADGSVVTGEGTPDVGDPRPFRWTQGTGLVALADSSGQMTRGHGFDISDDGSVIVGVGSSPGPNQAFRWTAATGMVGLGWLPAAFQDSFAFGTSGDGGVVCGISFSGPGADVETFRWTAATQMVGMGDVPGGLFYAIAWDVSGDGVTICGAARASSTTDELFVWTEAGGFVLPDPGHGASSSSSGEAVSADGSVVVGYGPGGAMIWDEVHGMRTLADVLGGLGVDLTGWQLGAASGVSADGRTICGNGLNPDGDQEAWIARLPESTASPVPSPRPGRAVLTAAGPNPFPERTAFRLALPRGGAHVHAVVHGIDGAALRVLADDVLPPGPNVIRWDGRTERGVPVAGGVYLLRVDAGAQRFVRKLVLLR